MKKLLDAVRMAPLSWGCGKRAFQDAKESPLDCDSISWFPAAASSGVRDRIGSHMRENASHLVCGAGRGGAAGLFFG